MVRENQYYNWSVFGLGKFGSVHAGDLEEIGLLKAAVDTDESKREVAENHGADFSPHDITQNVDIQRDENGRIMSHSYTSPESFPPLDSDVWDIVSDTHTHHPIMIAGLEEGKDILVEKPPVERVQDGEYVQDEFESPMIGVNYIEKQHPSVLASQAVLDEKGHDIGYMFNWRSKDLRSNNRGLGGGEGSRIILGDLVHDLSEIDAITERDIGEAEVSEAEIRRWNELDGDFPYTTDVEAHFGLELEGFKAEVRGSFADEERRCFVAVNQKEDFAVYTNTLSRDHIDPVAATVEGEENVQELVNTAQSGRILNNEQQEELLDSTGATRLYDLMEEFVPESKYKEGQPMFGWAPVMNQIKNFQEAEGSQELSTDLETALEYQRIAEEVYEKSRRPDAKHADFAR